MKRPAFSLLTTMAALAISTPAMGQSYASALAVGDDEIVVGEPTRSTPGAVYIYRRGADGNWMESAKLEIDGEIGDRFGRALAIQHNTLIVGATVVDSSTGAAYVFQQDETGAWRQTQRLTASDGSPGDAFGRVAAISGDFAFISTMAHNGTRGAVYVFHRDDSGSWSEAVKLMAADADSGDVFGTAIAVDGNVALIGAPQKNNRAGAVYVFRLDEAQGTWAQEAQLEGTDIAKNSFFGAALTLRGDGAFVGAPGHSGGGAVFGFRYDTESGEWAEDRVMLPFDGSRRGRYSIALAVAEGALWVGAPRAGGFEGRLYTLTREEESGEWTGAEISVGEDVHRGDQYAGTIALRGDIAVVGLPGDDYGAGTAIVFERDDATGEWLERHRIFSEASSFEPVLGEQVSCEDGVAHLFDCGEVDLVSFLPVSAIGGARGVRVNDLWGWNDPETGREYALIGRLDGTSFVDVSDPYNPVYLGNLPKTADSPGSTWRDIKVYKDHAFVVADGAAAHGMQVFDLTQLRNVVNAPVTFTETAHYDRIHSSHNIVINEAVGYAYAVGASAGGETCGGGLHMINIQDPRRPTFAGCFADESTGRRSTGYTHDAQCVTYHGPDEEHQGKEICLGANETALSIADVTDTEAPVALSTASYPNVGYAHQGWLTEDHRYFFMNDELDEMRGSVDHTRTLIWDLTDLDDPVLLKEHFGTQHSIDHNLFIKGNFMYQANYTSGLRVLDISDVENPVEVGYFDTVPYGDNSPSFGGSWSNYPFFTSGVIVVTSGSEGMFILKKKETQLIP